jgi:hypothetical protein
VGIFASDSTSKAFLTFKLSYYDQKIAFFVLGASIIPLGAYGSK